MPGCPGCRAGSRSRVTAAQSRRPWPPGLDEVVGPAADAGGRGQDVAACGAEVEVVAGQAAVVLAGAGEVGVHPAGRGPYVGCRAGDQAGGLEAGEGGVAVPGRAVLVDVQDVGAGGAGGDGGLGR